MTQFIKILGSGCSKCKNLAKLTEEVILENNLDANVEKIEDIMKIMEYNVMSTPALVVDNEVVVKGRVPSKDELLKILQSNKKTSTNNNDCCCGSDDCC